MVVFLPPQHTAAVEGEMETPPPPRKTPRPKRGPMEGEMDLTPMVDVVFQLLIFFMVTASFKMQRSLEQPKPEDNEKAASSQEDIRDNPDYVIVTVDATNTFQVEASSFDDIVECPSEQELLVKLRQARSGDSQGNIPTKMLVLGHAESLHERVVMALDAGTDVGMEDVQLMMIEGDDEG